MLKFLPLIALLVCSTAAPAAAQDENARVGELDGKLIYEAEGHRFISSLPLWFEEDATLGDHKVIISGDDNSTRFEIVPDGEDAQRWTYMYGMRIVREPERNLSDYRQAAAYGYALSCEGETGQIFLTDADTETDTAPLIFVCGKFIPSANRDGEGEMMAMAFRRTDAGIAVVYEEYRTGTFDGKDQSTWPISGSSIVARARDLLASAELTELDG